MISVRARAWTAIIALRSFAYAWTYGEVSPRVTETETFSVVVLIAPIHFYAACFAVVGIGAVVALIVGEERVTRFVAIVSVLFLLLFGLAILASWTWSPAGISMLALASMDILALSVPFRPHDTLRSE